MRVGRLAPVAPDLGMAAIINIHTRISEDADPAVQKPWIIVYVWFNTRSWEVVSYVSLKECVQRRAYTFGCGKTVLQEPVKGGEILKRLILTVDIPIGHFDHDSELIFFGLVTHALAAMEAAPRSHNSPAWNSTCSLPILYTTDSASANTI